MASGSIRNVSNNHLGMVTLQQAKQGLAGDATCARPQKGSSLSAITKLHSTQPWNCSRRNWLWWNSCGFCHWLYMVSHVFPISWGYPPRVYHLCLSFDIFGHYLRDTWKYICIRLKWLVSHCFKAWKGRTCITPVLKQPSKMSLSPTSITWHGGMNWKLAVGHARSQGLSPKSRSTLC